MLKCCVWSCDQNKQTKTILTSEWPFGHVIKIKTKHLSPCHYSQTHIFMSSSHLYTHTDAHIHNPTFIHITMTFMDSNINKANNNILEGLIFTSIHPKITMPVCLL